MIRGNMFFIRLLDKLAIGDQLIKNNSACQNIFNHLFYNLHTADAGNFEGAAT